MTTLIIILTLLIGGSSAEALHEHKQLQKAHSLTVQAQATATQIQGDNSALRTSLDNEHTARVAAADAEAKRWQLHGKYLVAIQSALRFPTPDVPGALVYTDAAITASDPLAPETIAQGRQLAAARADQRDQIIAKLQGENTQLKATVQQASAAADKYHADAVTHAANEATEAGTIKGQLDQIASVTEAKESLGLLAAKYGRIVFWCAVAAGVVFGLTWVFPAIARDVPSLAKLGQALGHGLFHPLVALFEDAHQDTKDALADVQDQLAKASQALAAEKAAHESTKAVLVAMAAAPAPTPAPVTVVQPVPVITTH